MKPTTEILARISQNSLANKEEVFTKLAEAFEKANPDIRGLYQAINNEFIRHEFSEVEFINREEDMGLPGLRQAKESYNPDHFAEKYDAVYANEADNATGGK